jgi:hypothetical protein
VRCEVIEIVKSEAESGEAGGITVDEFVNTVIKLQPLMDAMTRVGPDLGYFLVPKIGRLGLEEECSSCNLPITSEEHILREGEYGTTTYSWKTSMEGSQLVASLRKIRVTPMEIGPTLEYVSKHLLAWAPDLSFCASCWLSKVYLLQFCSDSTFGGEFTAQYIRILGAMYGDAVQKRSRWRSTLNASWDACDRKEDEARDEETREAVAKFREKMRYYKHSELSAIARSGVFRIQDLKYHEEESVTCDVEREEDDPQQRWR